MANTPNLVKTGQQIAFETTLATTIDADDTTIVLTSADGLPTTNFTLILDYDVAASREAISIESRTGVICTVYTDGRGYDSTSASGHTGGVCKVRATILPSQIDKIIDNVLTEHSDAGVHDSDKVVTLSSGDMTSAITGWVNDSDTWVYVSATSFKIEGKDVTSKFTKGTKVSYNDGSVDYGVVASSVFLTDTTVTLIPNDDYAIANDTLSAPRYSYVENPQGFPALFSFTGTLTGMSTTVTMTCQYSVDKANITISLPNTFATSNSTAMTMTGLPVTVAYGGGRTPTVVRDNGADIFGIYALGGTTINWYATAAAGNFTNSGSKGVFGLMFTYTF